MRKIKHSISAMLVIGSLCNCKQRASSQTKNITAPGYSVLQVAYPDDGVLRNAQANPELGREILTQVQAAMSLVKSNLQLGQGGAPILLTGITISKSASQNQKDSQKISAQANAGANSNPQANQSGAKALSASLARSFESTVDAYNVTFHFRDTRQPASPQGQPGQFPTSAFTNTYPAGNPYPNQTPSGFGVPNTNAYNSYSNQPSNLYGVNNSVYPNYNQGGYSNVYNSFSGPSYLLDYSSGYGTQQFQMPNGSDLVLPLPGGIEIQSSYTIRIDAKVGIDWTILPPVAIPIVLQNLGDIQLQGEAAWEKTGTLSLPVEMSYSQQKKISSGDGSFDTEFMRRVVAHILMPVCHWALQPKPGLGVTLSNQGPGAVTPTCSANLPSAFGPLTSARSALQSNRIRLIENCERSQNSPNPLAPNYNVYFAVDPAAWPFNEGKRISLYYKAADSSKTLSRSDTWIKTSHWSTVLSSVDRPVQNKACKDKLKKGEVCMFAQMGGGVAGFSGPGSRWPSFDKGLCEKLAKGSSEDKFAVSITQAEQIVEISDSKK